MKHVRPGVLLGIAILSLVSCDSMLNQLGIVSEQQLKSAKSKLEILSHDLPTLPGSILLESIDGTDQGVDKVCAAVYVAKLFGTNDQSLPQVLDAYTAVIPTRWQVEIAGDRGRTFKMSDAASLEVSDNYRFLPFSANTLNQAEKKFKTLYLILLSTPVAPGYPRGKCR